MEHAVREIIDVWAQLPTARFWREKWLASLMRWTGGEAPSADTPVEILIAAMDEARVSLSLISAWSSPKGDLISNDEVEAAIDAAPTRLKGLIGADISEPMEAVREIRRRAKSGKFVGVRIVPWLWDLPPNDRRYYPVYAACVDAGLPFCTQIGHTGPLKRSDTGRLIPYLEDVMIDFPELVVVGGHVGFPWLDEVLTMVRKFPNFHLDTSAYAIHRLPEEFVKLMKGEGKGRVMFGTNFPMLTAKRCLEKLDALGLDEEGKEAFLNDNARRVFRI
ncbi:MAG TPA: amidohydrolase family protein [Parvularculaceae bacterium]|nr:amidohydrolase family protein [Parvularculaceae bacterium]